MRSMDVRVQRPVRPVQVAERLRSERARTRGASLVCAMSCSGSFRDEPCHHASLCVWRQPCADECLNLTHVEPERRGRRHPDLVARTTVPLPPRRRLVWPAHAAHLREGLTPRLTGAGSRRLEGTNIGHENGEAMAYVGVRVEPTVRLGREGEGVVNINAMHWPF